MRRLEDGRLVHLHLQSTLQLEGPEAHQKAHGDGTQGQQQAESDGKSWKPPLDRGLGRTLAHRLTFRDRVAGCIHAEILLQGPLDEKKITCFVGVVPESQTVITLCGLSNNRTTQTPVHRARGSKRCLR